MEDKIIYNKNLKSFTSLTEVNKILCAACVKIMPLHSTMLTGAYNFQYLVSQYLSSPNHQSDQGKTKKIDEK
jgi:hypothetical protein